MIAKIHSFVRDETVAALTGYSAKDEKTIYQEKFREFVKDTSGAVLVYTVLVMSALLGFTGLAIDVGHWYATQRSMQSASDSAAVAGAFESMWGGDGAAVEAAAKEQAEANGFDPATVTVHFPPTSGPNVGFRGAVEVIIQQPTSGFFSFAYLDGAVDIAARAVAAHVAGVQGCMVALEPSEQGILVNSGSGITSNGCMVQVNSTSSSAMRTNGASTVTAELINIAGDYEGSGYSPPPETGTPPMDDPLAYLQPPASAGDICDHTGLSIDAETTTISPGVYCNDFVLNAGSIITMDPGTYVIRDGKFEVNSGANLSGDGVTIYLMGSAEFILNSDSHAELTAPTEGEFAGILIFQDRNVADGTVHLFNSDTTTSLVGAVYFPNGKIMINSGSTLGPASAFSAFIAKTYEINSGSHLVLNSDYEATDVPALAALGAYKVALIE